MSAADASRDAAGHRLKPPSTTMMLAEARAILEFNASLVLAPLLMMAPRGDGHPILVLPGFLAGDLSTAFLRRFLRAVGHEPHAWDLGRNVGGVYRMREQLRDRLATIHREAKRKVSLVGWSLGGVYARDLALHMPETVRSVTTLGSPFANDLTATSIRKLYEDLSGERISDARIDDVRALAGDLAVPATSIYTRSDGIVHWRTCLLQENDRAENIEILLASHVGLGVNAAALWAIADRLAQPEGVFKPFKRGGPFALAYAPAERRRN